MKQGTVTVFTNLACNQRCGFCTFRRAEDAPGFTDARRIQSEIAAARDARTIVFSGGEPTMLAELPEHVRFARASGIEDVVVETNGMLLAYPGRARALADAGVSTVRVAIFAADASSSDATSQTPGGFALTLRGMKSALAAGMRVEASVAVTLPHLGELPSLAEQLPDGVRDILLRVVTDADATWVARYEDAARAVMELTDRARERDITVRFDGRHAIPLCFFPERRRYPELFAGGVPREAHGMARIAACEGCAARERCPGISERYLAVHGEAGAAKVSEKQSRFVLGLGRDRRAAVEHELVNDNFYGQGGGGLERVLRINFHCNQACGFCFVDRTLPSVSRERIEAEIHRAKEEGVTLLSLSGGEPTLHPNLKDFVRLAQSSGMRVQLQTNAVRCADPDFARALAGAGLSRAFVSLHAASAAVSDEITAAPGTFDRTVLGIDQLLSANVQVLANFVITGENMHELPAYARLVAQRWSGKPFEVNFSFAHASTALVPRDARTIPKMSEARPYIGEALALLCQAGVMVHGFDGQCGMPFCVLDPEWLDVDALAPLPSTEPAAGFLKTDACARCELSSRCVGLRETYAALHGTGELTPVVRSAAR